jgi:NUMOD3 motif
LKTGGNRPVYSEESKKKMSESSKGRTPWNKGLTAEDPRVASYVRSGKDSHLYGKPSIAKGRKRSLEEIERHRLAVTGQKRTEEQRKKNSDSHIKTPIFCKENGKRYESIMEASRDLKINSGQIYHVLNGTRKSAKGHTFSKEIK